jgi:Ca-activated chloride channel homolog
VNYFLRFAQPIFFAIGLLALVFALLYRWWFAKSPVYRYPLATMLYRARMTTRHPFKKIFWVIRFLVLVLLAALIAKPQLVDMRTKATIKGINIMMVLDVSGSMEQKDYSDDDRSRFEVAQEEAVRFIKARQNDAIGLVLFGMDAISRAPLTFDKKMLTSIVQETQLGIVNPDGTVLSRGIVTAANRLKTSTAKSNVMIVLTDGSPSPEDIHPSIAIEIAKQLGIKIYTIGIGSDKERVIIHPRVGMVVYPKVNKELLEEIAAKTGGKSFMAKNAEDMRTVYETIDKLEKTEYEAPVYNKYYDIFMPFLWILLILMGIEIVLSSTIWFGL